MKFENEYFQKLLAGLSFKEGGVTAPKGFKASGVHCGLRKNAERKDLAMIAADVPCSVAAVYTTNKVYGAPITVTRENISCGLARAVICNSGNANTCNADGVEKARMMSDAAATALGIPTSQMIVASTGVIGQVLPIEPILSGIPLCVKALSSDGSDSAAQAIMTTDTRKKEFALTVNIGGTDVMLGAICKGSGMIEPNMGTMLCFMTTDAAVSSPVLDTALRYAVHRTLNMVSVDGDTSTNDMACIMASGLAGNSVIDSTDSAEYEKFRDALTSMMHLLATSIAGDGEGATKLLECRISGAVSQQQARILAKSVIKSPLVKTAMFGADANWGRVLCALGYAGTEINVDAADVAFISEKGCVEVCKNGRGLPFSEEKAKEILLEKSIVIDVRLNSGSESAFSWGCDLSYDYVRINGDYRS